MSIPADHMIHVGTHEVQLASFRKRICKDTGDDSLVVRDPTTGEPDYSQDNGVNDLINDAIEMLSNESESDWLFPENVRTEIPCVANTAVIPVPFLKQPSAVFIKVSDVESESEVFPEQTIQNERSGAGPAFIMRDDLRAWRSTYTITTTSAEGEILPAISLKCPPETTFTLVVIGAFEPFRFPDEARTNYLMQHNVLILEYAVMCVWESKQRNQEGLKEWRAILNDLLVQGNCKRIAAGRAGYKYGREG
jgi:hypothetical protein